MPEEKEIAVLGANTSALIPGSMTVFAQNPHQMQESQQQMVIWAKAKVAEHEKDLAELKENLELAEANSWNTSALKNAVRRTKKQMFFFEKAKQAFEAGYYMIPNFPTGAFAIRTTRKEPKRQGLKKFDSYIQDEESTSPPAGKGEYVSPEVAAVAVKGPDRDGEKRTFWEVDDEFEEVHFPFTFVRPEIAKATSRAMALKVFDSIGCLPKPKKYKRKSDPIIVGTITQKEGYSEHTMTFLIAWFMDLDKM